MRKTCLKPSEVAEARAIASAIQELSAYKEMVAEPTIAEVTFCWNDLEFDLPCKVRPDLTTLSYLTIGDFKSAANPTHGAFQAAAYRYHYYVSAAFTFDGVYAVTGIKPRRYLYLVGQSTSPHLAAAYEVTEDELALGRAFVRRNLRRLRECLDSGQWPGLPDAITPLGLPPWVEVGDDPDDFSKISDGNWWE
jgi:exodeoxyribonuclease VIII